MHSLALTDATVRRGSRTVLDRFSWILEPGITALLGPNGAGKSTLLQAAVGLLPLAAGRRIVLGQDATDEIPRDILNQISWLPQSPDFPSGVRVADAVAHAAWLKGVPAPDRRAAIESAIDAVNLTPKAKSIITRLSGGEQRRAALATTLVGSPRILVLDEPTVGLDPDQRDSILHTLRAAVSDSSLESVLISTHLLEDVLLLADRVQVLRDGTVTRSANLNSLSPEDAPQYAALEVLRNLYQAPKTQ